MSVLEPRPDHGCWPVFWAAAVGPADVPAPPSPTPRAASLGSRRPHDPLQDLGGGPAERGIDPGGPPRGERRGRRLPPGPRVGRPGRGADGRLEGGLGPRQSGPASSRSRSSRRLPTTKPIGKRSTPSGPRSRSRRRPWSHRERRARRFVSWTKARGPRRRPPTTCARGSGSAGTRSSSPARRPPPIKAGDHLGKEPPTLESLYRDSRRAVLLVGGVRRLQDAGGRVPADSREVFAERGRLHRPDTLLRACRGSDRGEGQDREGLEGDLRAGGFRRGPDQRRGDAALRRFRHSRRSPSSTARASSPATRRHA